MAIDIRKVLSRELQEQIEESFGLSTGFGVVFTDPDGNHLGAGSNFRELCKGINDDAEGRASCVRSNCHAITLGLSTSTPSIYVCHAGMINIEIPLVIDGECIGAITAGQVFAEDSSQFRGEGERLPTRWRTEEPFCSYYEEIPTLSNKQILAASAALEKFAQYILAAHRTKQMHAEIHQREKELFETQLAEQLLKQQLAEARFSALQKQITPHFSLNILSSISRLIELGEHDKAQRMLHSYQTMLRYHYGKRNAIVPLLDEIGYVSEYLQIQKIRFEDRVTYTLQIDPQLHRLSLPMFSLQPFVENALEHGLLTKEKGGRLTVTASLIGEQARLTIVDDGVGIERLKLAEIHRQLLEDSRVDEEAGFGIVNSRQRLAIFFGEALTDFRIESLPGQGTRICIELAVTRPL